MTNLLMLFIFIPFLIFVLLFLNFLLASSDLTGDKISIYECGFTPVYGQTRSTFHINFYVVAILFLVFDLELVLIFPLAVTLTQVGLYGLGIAILFFLVLTVGFVFEISSGALKLSKNDFSHSK
jgi:NADH-ubiquinone oxidoreductase chain 3